MNLGNESSNGDKDRSLQLIPHTCKEDSKTSFSSKEDVLQALTCPCCGYTIQVLDQRVIHELPGLPAGVKFDPSDVEILEHLEAKVLIDKGKLHPLIDEFIPTIEGESGICYTHPENLPGVSKEGQIRHFFHRPSKAYTTGTRKRRKVITEEDNGGGAGGGETRWHKTGKTKPIFTANNKAVKGYKKILVLYSYYGSHRKPEKTNWIMHQYHLGVSEDEKDGEFVVSKVFYQTQPRQPNTDGCRKKNHEVHEPSYLHVDPPLTTVMEEEPHKKSRSSSFTDGHHSSINAMNDTNVLMTHQWATGDEDHKYVNTIIKNTNDFGPNQFNYVMYDMVGNDENRQSSLPTLMIPDQVSDGEESSFMNFLPSVASKGK